MRPVVTDRSVQPFLNRWPKSMPILYNGPLFPFQNCSFSWGYADPHLIHHSLGPAKPITPNGISIGSAILQGSLCDRRTDHATRSVTIGRIYVRSTAMRSNNNNKWSKYKFGIRLHRRCRQTVQSYSPCGASVPFFPQLCRPGYWSDRAQNLSRPAPDSVLRVLKISSKSVQIWWCYTRTREHRQNEP